MCRNIKTLYNFDPHVTPEEIRSASLQFVRKISGFSKPSKTNEATFLAAVDEIAAVSTRLLSSLETNAPPKNREEEAAKSKVRASARFGAGENVNVEVPKVERSYFGAARGIGPFTTRDEMKNHD